MKYIIAIFLCLSFTVLNAQSFSQFRGKLNIYVSTGTAPNFTINGLFQDDDKFYSSDSIQVNDIIYVPTLTRCAKVRVTAITSKTGSVFIGTVQDLDLVLTAGFKGISGIVRPTTNKSFPVIPTGLPTKIESCMLTDFARMVDTLTTIAADSISVLEDSIIVVYNGETELSRDTIGFPAATITDLGYTPSPTNGIVTNTAGTNATLPLGDPTNAGLAAPGTNTAAANFADGVGTTEITNNAVTNAKAAQMPANTIKGNNTGSVSNSIDLTTTETTALLNVATTSLKGLMSSTDKVKLDAYPDYASALAAINYWTLSGSNVWRNSNVGIGVDPSTTAKLLVRGNGASTGLALLLENSSGTDNFWVTDAGNATMGIVTSGQINITTTGGTSHGIRAANFSIGTGAGLIQSNTNVVNAIGLQMLAWNGYVSGARNGQWISLQMRDTIGALFTPSGIKLFVDQGAVLNGVGGISFYNAVGSPTVGLTAPSTLTEVGTIVGRNWGINDNTPDFLFDVEGKLAAQHFIAQGTNPTVVVGAGAGTGASVTVTTADISDAAGRLDIVMGSSGTAGGTLATFTFASAFTKAPTVKLQAENGNTAEAWTDIWVVPTTTGFTIECDADLQPLIGASITLKISYQTIGVD